MIKRILRKSLSINASTIPRNTRREYVSFRELIDDTHKKAALLDIDTNFPRSVKLDGKFISPWTKDTDRKGFDKILKFLITKKQNRVANYKVDDVIKPQRIDLEKISSTDEPHHTWIGHATSYCHMDGAFFLTDPIWSAVASPISFIGPKRYIEAPIAVEKLPLDFVLLSHTHYDHLDYATVQRIGNRAIWVVPLGVKEILRGMGVDNCVELDWWDTFHYKTSKGKQIEIIFTPSKHWTARSFFDRNSCLWGSYAVLSEKFKFFFTGDTAYCSVFKQIGDQFNGFDLATIPIGAYKPRWFLKDVHCNPTEALKIHSDLKAKQSVGIHWGTFPMSDEDFIEPAMELGRARKVLGVNYSNFYCMAHGETLRPGEVSKFDIAENEPHLYNEYLKYLKKSRRN